ncbi:MAG: hypothetical protein RL689_10 [Planctomycetota bacterium]
MGQAYARGQSPGGAGRGGGGGRERSYSGIDVPTTRAFRPAGKASPRSCDLSDEPKLIIDSDWKSQAQAEKEKLAEKAAPKPQEAADLRDVGFEDLVGMLATNTLSYLGYVPDPYTGQAMVSIEYAKFHIDLLGILEQKTKGNLSETEKAALEKALSQLRMAFVEVSKAVAKAIQEGKIKPAQAGGMPSGMAGGESSGVAGKIGPEGSGLITS